MVLTGQAKTDYQREYMRKRRSNAGSNKTAPVRPNNVRPTLKLVRPEPVRPEGLSDNQWAYIQMKAESETA